jgi:hypothetical protein
MPCLAWGGNSPDVIFRCYAEAAASSLHNSLLLCFLVGSVLLLSRPSTGSDKLIVTVKYIYFKKMISKHSASLKSFSSLLIMVMAFWCLPTMASTLDTTLLQVVVENQDWARAVSVLDDLIVKHPEHREALLEYRGRLETLAGRSFGEPPGSPSTTSPSTASTSGRQLSQSELSEIIRTTDRHQSIHLISERVGHTPYPPIRDSTFPLRFDIIDADLRRQGEYGRSRMASFVVISYPYTVDENKALGRFRRSLEHASQNLGRIDNITTEVEGFSQAFKKIDYYIGQRSGFAGDSIRLDILECSTIIHMQFSRSLPSTDTEARQSFYALTESFMRNLASRISQECNQ